MSVEAIKKFSLPDDVLSVIASFNSDRASSTVFQGVCHQWYRAHLAAMEPLWQKTLLESPALQKHIFTSFPHKEPVLGDPSSFNLGRLRRLSLDFQRSGCWRGFSLSRGKGLQEASLPQYAQAMAEFLADKDTPLKTIWAALYLTSMREAPSQDLSTDQIKEWLLHHADDLAEIETLDLSRLGLSKVPPLFCSLSLPNLRSLSLAGNRLDSLPVSFGARASPDFTKKAWPKLKVLDLSDNRFYLPPPTEHQDWPELRELSLRGNLLRTLPSTFTTRWPKLELSAIKV